MRAADCKKLAEKPEGFFAKLENRLLNQQAVSL